MGSVHGSPVVRRTGLQVFVDRKTLSREKAKKNGGLAVP